MHELIEDRLYRYTHRNKYTKYSFAEGELVRFEGYVGFLSRSKSFVHLRTGKLFFLLPHETVLTLEPPHEEVV